MEENYKNAVRELESAIDYIDFEYSCDDRSALCPNPDGLAMSLRYIINKIDTLEKTLELMSEVLCKTRRS